jgi:hypothetical protein
MARKAKAKAKTKSKVSKKPTASAAQPAARRIVETTTFRSGKSGKIFHMALKTKQLGKIITASVGGRVKSIAISR